MKADSTFVKVLPSYRELYFVRFSARHVFWVDAGGGHGLGVAPATEVVDRAAAGSAPTGSGGVEQDPRRPRRGPPPPLPPTAGTDESRHALGAAARHARVAHRAVATAAAARGGRADSGGTPRAAAAAAPQHGVPLPTDAAP